MLDRFFPGRQMVAKQQEAMAALAQERMSAITARQEKNIRHKRSVASSVRKSYSSFHTSLGPSMRHVNRDGAKSYGTLSL